ncbi:MAG: YerC/YecD family TrpR-related protein [Parcubacteria group bacterium]
MPKRSTNWNDRKANELFEAVLTLKTKDECRRFFRDLCTLEEITDMVDRWQMVKLLVKGNSYREVAGKLRVSATTVARVADWFRRGMGGYQLVVKRLRLESKGLHHHHAASH